jgi:hypothetical protein
MERATSLSRPHEGGARIATSAGFPPIGGFVERNSPPPPLVPPLVSPSHSPSTPPPISPPAAAEAKSAAAAAAVELDRAEAVIAEALAERPWWFRGSRWLDAGQAGEIARLAGVTVRSVFAVLEAAYQRRAELRSPAGYVVAELRRRAAAPMLWLETEARDADAYGARLERRAVATARHGSASGSPATPEAPRSPELSRRSRGDLERLTRRPAVAVPPELAEISARFSTRAREGVSS